MSRKALHAHGCRRCRIRYMDACQRRDEDDMCIGCRGGRPWQLLIDNAAPHRCCLKSRPVTKDEKSVYLLAGRSNWTICPECRRTHPYRVTEEKVQ